jgi:hypothetical protein
LDVIAGLRASRDGTSLYAKVQLESGAWALGQWRYFNKGESGQWTIKGEHVLFSASEVPFSDSIANNGTQLIVGGPTTSSPFYYSGVGVQGYSLEHENWVDNHVLIGDTVTVVRSSASTLSSFLTFLL